MLSMYGGAGMGASGMGSGGGQGISLQQLLDMLQQTGGGGMQPPGTPLHPGNAPTPMANMIGLGGGMHSGGQTPLPPVPAPPQAQPVSAQSAMPSSGLLDMLKLLRDQQTGVKPTGQPSPQAPGQAAQNPQAATSSPGILEKLAALFSSSPRGQ